MRSPDTLPELLHARFLALQARLQPLLQGGLIVAFSGGTDSAFLLWAAEQERRARGGRLLAVTAVSASLPEVERHDAVEFAAGLGVEHRCEPSEEISDPAYARNALTRCYPCKTELFRLSHRLGSQLGYATIAYGYNASDRSDFRPGHKAAVEQNIAAPLSDVDLSKDDIRALLHFFDLPLADKPASPCLSSRLMTGVAVTPEKLKDIEELEAMVRQSGVRVFRMRLHEHPGGRWLRLEVVPDEMARILNIREELLQAAKDRGFSWLTLDLAGYRLGGGTRQPALSDARTRTA